MQTIREGSFLQHIRGPQVDDPPTFLNRRPNRRIPRSNQESRSNFGGRSRVHKRQRVPVRRRCWGPDFDVEAVVYLVSPTDWKPRVLSPNECINGFPVAWKETRLGSAGRDEQHVFPIRRTGVSLWLCIRCNVVDYMTLEATPR